MKLYFVNFTNSLGLRWQCEMTCHEAKNVARGWQELSETSEMIP